MVPLDSHDLQDFIGARVVLARSAELRCLAGISQCTQPQQWPGGAGFERVSQKGNIDVFFILLIVIYCHNRLHTFMYFFKHVEQIIWHWNVESLHQASFFPHELRV